MKGSEKANQIHFDLDEFVTALKRVSVLSSKEKHSVVRLNIGKKNTIVSCESLAFSTKAEESVDSTFFEKRLIGYNYKYMIEILSIFDKKPELFIDERNCLFIKLKKKIGALSPVMLNQ
jgi:DNA polymerase III sliding clamp (beta) subunit (PCNA family)